ncbi:MAG: hypothetical protein ACE5KE_00325 [Methanosarcinales archaeon]
MIDIEELKRKTKEEIKEELKDMVRTARLYGIEVFETELLKELQFRPTAEIGEAISKAKESALKKIEEVI